MGRRGSGYAASAAPIVLVDLFMPERDGVEVIRALRQGAPDTWIVAMSAGGHHRNVEMLRVAAGLGAKRTLRKPFVRAEPLATIRELLEAQP